ncbi:unnamed protein product [Caenorhabditis brenneri]
MNEFSITQFVCPKMPMLVHFDEESRFASSESSTPSSTDTKSEGTSPGPDPLERPPYSYNALIAMAIQNSPEKKLRLHEIYHFISCNFPYYSAEKARQWKNSIRHNLSLHKEFQKVKPDEKNGLGNYWEMVGDCSRGIYVKKQSGRLCRSKETRKSKTKALQSASESPVLPNLPQLPILPNPLFSNATSLLQNSAILQLLLQNLQLQNLQALPAPSNVSMISNPIVGNFT